MKIRFKRLLALIVVLIAIGGLGKSVLACDCMRLQAASEELKRSSAVFVGVVTVANRADQLVVQFQVERAWKGPRTKKLTLRMPVNSCNFGFKVGEKYLVYAEGGKVLSTSICSRTKRYDQATADLSVLGEGKKV
ncbi:MAG: hypothetical protein JST85_01850 [Acidobacteria bacterium]|nr:hypothetical protein [Acidobacteriota bacterium]